MSLQIALPFQFNDQANFTNFWVGDNQQLVYQLQHLSLSEWDYRYIYGPAGSGKTHLLQACCSEYATSGRRVSYVNLAEFKAYGVEVLQGCEEFELVAWDNMDAVARDAEWERALFNHYNELMRVGRTLLISANQAPDGLGLQLADLRSRLHAGVIYALKEVADEGKMAVLQQRAASHGLQLSDEVALYLMSHHQRDLPALLNTLTKLDHASLAEKRKLTIPFVKTVLFS